MLLDQEHFEVVLMGESIKILLSSSKSSSSSSASSDEDNSSCLAREAAAMAYLDCKYDVVMS
jgi:hypothetical protein